MTAQELRIGNYFQDEDKLYHKTTPNVIEALWESENRKWIKPIPLTEEWLLRFGFKDEGDGYFSKWNGDYDYSISLIDGFSYGQCADYSHPIKLKYVHQLQNLFFALTGEELTIKQ